MKFGKLRSFKPGESREKPREIHAIAGRNPSRIITDELMAMKARVASRMDDLAEEVERMREERYAAYKITGMEVKNEETGQVVKLGPGTLTIKVLESDVEPTIKKMNDLIERTRNAPD